MFVGEKIFRRKHIFERGLLRRLASAKKGDKGIITQTIHIGGYKATYDNIYSLI